MHLLRLEIQGFKTFAKKTTLSFLPPKGSVKPITAIVGPNGSGKSNIADAIRWVLGEQSVKALRGKKSEDIIFSGSNGRGRSGFAETAITFNNEDKAMPVDFAEVTITRRLYRDGESEYLLNGVSARLADIHLLLAQAHVGQRSYSVVGQGMVDHILIASPEERKAFFDDATGVRQFQIKRHEAMLKLKRTYENMAEVDMLLQEIEPRLRSLRRQTTRLEERARVERNLRDVERAYYGTLWWNLHDQLNVAHTHQIAADTVVATERQTLSELEARVNQMEKEEKGKDKTDQGLVALQAQFKEAQKERSRIRDQQYETQKHIELGKIRAQNNWAPLPLLKIIEELGMIEQEQKDVLARVRAVETIADLRKLDDELDRAVARTGELADRLQGPAPEEAKPDAALVSLLASLEKERAKTDAMLEDVEKNMQRYAVTEKQVRHELFDLQRELRERQRALHAAEMKRNETQIDLARFEERRMNLGREMDEQLKEGALSVRAKRPEGKTDTDKAYPNMQSLRAKLELIGGIDPEIVKEFEETKARFEFLDAHIKDVRAAAISTEKVLDELDGEIKVQSEKAFRQINKHFQHFFKILFGDGSCSLVQLTRDDLTPKEEDVNPQTVATEERHHEEDSSSDIVKEKIREREDRIVGIDIQATPPGKRLKSLNLLSGGERALTSIALVSAIMAVNPAPFVVLDEVDAALDEANTYRFAHILEELSALTQFVIITHNRATMEKAGLLYGVTMGEEGVSNLVSVNMENLAPSATARR